MGTLADLREMLGKANSNAQATVSVPGLTAVSVAASDLYGVLPAPALQTKYVNTPGSTLNVRATPSTSAAILAQLAHGTKITVSRTVQDATRTWAAMTDGKVGGWVAAEYLSDTPTLTQPLKAGYGLHLFPGPATDEVVGLAAQLKNEGNPLAVLVIVNEANAVDRVIDNVRFVVYRDVPKPDNPDNPTDEQYAGGDGARWAAALMPRYAGISKRAYLQLMNEGNWHPNAGAFWLKAMQYADLIGRKLAIFAYSIGNPNDEGGTTAEQKWQALLPALAYARANGHVVAMHAYSKRGTPAGQMTEKSDRHNYEGRFIRLWNSVPESARPILLFTEVASEFARGAYQGDDPCVAYAESHLRYVSPYPYVGGDALWTVNGTGNGWDDANINPALPKLSALFRRRL